MTNLNPLPRHRPTLKNLASFWIFLLAATSNGVGAYPLADNFENGLANWTTNGGWGLTTARSSSPSWSVTDSPGSFYADNTDARLSLAASLNLATATRPAVGFRHAYSLEKGYDFGRVEVSIDGGGVWTPLLTVSGQLTTLSEEQVDLSIVAGQGDVRLRFRLLTDASVVMDGWYVDDISIGEAPEPVSAGIGTEVTPNSVPVWWTRSHDASFAGYCVYRSQEASVDWHFAQLLTQIGDPLRTNYVDLSAAPKTRYYYRVLVLNSAGLRSASAAVSASTPPGMNYPFLDTGEGGPGTWNAAAPWGLSDEDAISGTHAWSDSPGGPYANGIASQPLTLAAPLNLAGAAAPVLTFNHKHDFAPGDSGYVETSLNQGTDWTALTNFVGGSSGQWRRARVSLAAQSGQPAVLVRFRLTTDGATAADGWHLDDISVAESPATVPAPTLDEIASHSMRLTWLANTNRQFSHYAILRSTAPGVNIGSQLVAALSNQTLTTWTDTGLALDTVYYYRVYAVSPYGAFSDNSLTESSARTLNNPPPFTDGFEAGLIDWNVSGAWGLTTNRAATGLFCLADSPMGNYDPNQDTWAATAVNLAGTAWPVLEFKERCLLGEGDWARVEVSGDGANWQAVYGAMGRSAEWTSQTIDLSPWRNQSNLRIRFRMGTDSQTPEDGWYIDDVRVAEHTAEDVSYPVFEGFETGLQNWFACGWTRVTNEPHAGSFCMQDSLTPRLAPSSQVALHLAGPLTLTSAVNPQIAVWTRGVLNPYAWFRIQVLPQGGYDWQDLTEASLDHPFNAGWTRRQASLRAYTNQSVRLRFLLACDWRAPEEDLFLDKIAIAEMPEPVTLNLPTPHLRTADLSWTPSALGGAFKRYELYRATHPTVTPADTFLGAFASIQATNHTDTGLSIGATYYYRVFTVDTNDLFSGSNEGVTTTVPLALPVADSLDNADQWVVTGKWGISASPVHGGGGALSDSPNDNYDNNSDTYAMTAVNLTGSFWPVLRFWDSHRLAEGDWARVEISTDGANWQSLYGVMGARSEWREQLLDLSPWKNQSNLRLRFRLGADGAAADDGWHIDDLAIAENPPAAIPFPFFEGFEAGLQRWLHSGWVVVTNQSLAEGHSAQDTDTPRMAPQTELALQLAGPIHLTNTLNPQMVLWARGVLNPYAWFRIQVSADHGLSWQELASANLDYPFNAGWTRRQASLQAFTNRVIRLRLATLCDWRAPEEDIYLDKIAITEMPAPVFVFAPTPHLRSADLSWTQSSLEASFQRYEVYRATHAGVTLADTFLGAFTNIEATAFTDTGLTIGSTYYYKVFTVDTNDLYSDSNEPSTTTVPLALPVADAMENANLWVTTGSWGIDTNAAYSGAGSLNDSPLSEYGNNSDTWALTAVNLNGSIWPVMRFMDRHRIGVGDWGRVEVSPDGANWQSLYGVMGVRTHWAQQVIDLSPWKNQTNLRIRFRQGADGSNVDDGWFIDDFSITDQPAAAVPYPFYDGFENGLSNWFASGWTRVATEPMEGQWAMQDTPTSRLGPQTELTLNLAGPIVLTNANQPEITFWVRGRTEPNVWLRLQVSTDAGLGWADLSSVNVDHPFAGGWTRKHASLGAYAGRSIRLRFYAACDWRAPDEDLVIDKIAIEDAPPAVILAPIADATVSTLRLNWTESPLANFKEYRVFRSESPNVDENATLLATITDRSVTSFVDTGLTSRKLYYYRVYVYNAHDTGNGSNQASVMTLGVPLGWSDGFESSQPAWTLTGSWTRQAGPGQDGGTALVDSPADYANSSDTYAQFAVNLVGSVWPVLRFRDRHALADGDFGRLELSPDGGGSWNYLYGAAATRTNWNEQAIDLSRWKTQSQVWLRFRLFSDGATQADGWYLDDVSVSENAAPAASYPFFDGFEQGLSRWQSAGWTLDSEAPHDGAQSVRDTPAGRMSPNAEYSLTLASELRLTNAADPQLSFWVRGQVNPYAWLRAQVSTDGGLSWADLSSVNLDYPFNSGWVHKQVSLAAYTNRAIRFRLFSSCDWRAPDEDLFIDDLGIGEPAPGSPNLNAPAALASVGVVRPTLAVNNAIDYQSDPLSYRFEVYADSGLSHLMAQVPAIASGSQTTSWLVDADLPNNHQYWWRCRASDGTNTGPWMSTATFFVNEVNHPPSAPVLAGPPDGMRVANLDALLIWFPASDPDEGDEVAAYEVQVDEEAAFVTPAINATNVPAYPTPEGAYWTIAKPLAGLVGPTALTSGTIYHWRVRARDLRGLQSAWSTGPMTFQFGAPTPRGGAITVLKPAGNGVMAMEWAGAQGSIFVDFTYSLTRPNWLPVAGPLQGTNWLFTPVPGASTGFYRLRAQ